MESPSQRFQRLLEPVHDRAVAFARGVCRSRSDGDDLMQEALLRALDKLPSLRDDGAFRFWLYRVIISVHRNRYKRSFWRRLLPLEAETEPASPDRNEELGGAERARLALAELPHEQREAIVLFELEGWKVEEIADLLGVSISAVKSRLVRGRERLRTIYTRKLGAPAVPRALLPGESR
ncbi:MAG: RNA polymerase sigma factor [Deltaproteobacteria bacterium]|nr:RNA polymerase sigma factor [Deltaproteobacteria bacterium]